MFWLRLFTFALIIGGLAFIVTQIILPLLLSRKLFPLFRKAEKDLSGQYIELNQQLHEMDLKEKVVDLSHQLHDAEVIVKGKVDDLERKLHPTTPSETPAPTEQAATDKPQS